MRTARVLVVLLPLLAGCQSAEERTQERQKALEESKAKHLAEKAKGQAAAPTEEAKDSYWDAPSLQPIKEEGPCPEGMWSLFKLPAPGQTPAEKKANEANRSELAAKLRATSFLVKFRSGLGVQLRDYDAAKGLFPVEINATFDCHDSAGRVTVALGDAKALTPPGSASQEGAEIVQNIWQAPPFLRTFPQASMSEAKEWKSKNQLGLEARFIFTLGAASVDTKRFKTTKVTSGEISIGGGNEDWGAGRMVRAKLVAERLTAERGTKTLVETKY